MMKKILTGIIIAAVAVLGVFLVRYRMMNPDPINLAEIHGCPEFYHLEWGQTLQQAEGMVLCEHTSMPAGNNSEPFLSASNVRYYTERAETVYCSFRGGQLNAVMYLFNRDDTSMTELVDLLTKVYGDMSEANMWKAPFTTIELWDQYEIDKTEKSVVLRYTRTENSQYTMLSYVGTHAADPYLLESENNLFNESIKAVLHGLVEDIDYSVTLFNDYTTYTLYPKFEYLSLLPGYSAIELYTPSGSNEITKASYILALDNQDGSLRTKQIMEINDALNAQYGAPIQSFFTPFSYEYYFTDENPHTASDALREAYPVTDLLTKAAAEDEGFYHIQWQNGSNIITLSVIINYNDAFTNCAISFTTE